MSHDVDDLLRRAMATLDRQVPPDTFDALASRVLARLEDPAIAVLRDEDAAPGVARGRAGEPGEDGEPGEPAEQGAGSASSGSREGGGAARVVVASPAPRLVAVPV